MRNSDDNAPQDQNLIGASVTDLTAEDINTSENSPYTATATAVDRVDSQDESRADKDGSDVLDTPDISFLLKDYDNHFDGLGDLSFSQEGSDLRVVDGDGNEYIIAGYFDEAPPPSLRISESTELPFDFVQTLLAGTDLPAASGETPRATMVDAHDYAEYGSSIGNVETIVGEVKIIRTDGQTQILEAGDPVFEGDQILTETGASVKLVFLDNTLFSLGEDAQMTLDKMLYNAEEESGEVVLSMLKGMFLFVSGKIAKTDPTDMVVNTPVATIGIRGTIVTGRIDPDAQQTFEITVIDGAIATIPSGSDEPIVMSESFSTIIGENNAAGNLEISQSQETPQAVVARNVQQFSVLSSEDLQGIELAVESSAAESGEDVDLDLESALEIAVENETLGDVDTEQEDAVVDTPIPDAPAASNGAEEVEFESDVLLEDERPLEETLELEEEEESKGLEPAPELDITPPDPPLFVLAVNENNYLESGNSIIEGETEAGALVSVTLAGSLTNPDGTVSQSEAVFETLADDAGNWAIDFENDDPVSGNYNFAEESEVQLSVTAADASGNVSDAETGSFNFDLTAPEAPVIAPDSSVSYTASDNTTYIDGKTLSGTAEAGTTVHVTVDSETIAVTADESGNWTLDLGDNGIKHDHGDSITVSVQSEDKAGNLSETTTQTYVIDSQTTAPQIVFNDLKNGATDNSPALSGTAEPGATVSIVVEDSKGNDETFSVTANSDGDWSLSIDSNNAGNLSLEHDVTLTAKATATDLAGNTSGTSSTSVKVDNSTTLSDVKFDKVVDGAVDGDPPLVDGTPLLSGTAEPGSEVVVTVTDGNNNQTTFTPTVDASGNWSVMIVSKDDFEIKDGGSFSVKVDSTDELGNEDSVDLGSYTVDNSTTLTNVAFENTLTDTAEESFVGAEPVLKGIAEPGAKVTVIAKDKDGNEATFEPEVNAETGAWSVTVKGDPDGTGFAVTDDGELSVTVDSKDELGNEATQVSLGPYTVDASVSVSDVAFVDAIYPDDDSPGTVGDDPVLSGKAEVGATVTVTVTNEHKETATFTHTVDSSGEWSVQIVDQGDFKVNHDGTLVVGVDVADDLGNTKEVALDPYKVDASTTDPVFEFTTGTDDTSDKTPELVGTAEADAIVSVKVTDSLTPANSETFTVTADSNGDWSLSIDSNNAGSLSLGHDVTLTAEATSTDIHNNESNSSKAEVTIDAEADVGTFAFEGASGTTVGEEPVLSGQAVEPNSKVIVIIEDTDTTDKGTFSTTADADGNWSITVTTGGDSGNDALVVDHDTPLSVSVTVFDEHNNSTTEKSADTYTVDAFTAAPTIAFDVASDGASDNTPRLSGTAEAGSKVAVTISDGTNSETITVDADSSGNWSLDLDSTNAGSLNLADGSTLTASATATDIHNNVSDPSAQATATVDAFTAAPTIAFDVASDGASDNTPRLSGTAEAGSKVAVTISDGTNSETITVDADSSGNWSLDLDSTNAGSLNLADGSTLTASATATDIHNNVSDPSAQATATVDAFTAAPTIAFDVASDGASDNTPRLSGTAEAGSKVAVTISDGTNSETITVDADSSGNWSLDLDSTNAGSLNLADGSTLTASATATDIHNNVSDPSAQATATVDAFTAAPTIAFDVASDGASDNTPRLSGTAEAGSKVAVTISDGTNSETITVDADSSGNWSLDLDSTNAGSLNLADGSTLTASATATDIHNNVSDPSAQATATVDAFTAAPTIAFDVASDGASDNTPRLSGTAEAGSKVAVTISDGTNSETITVDADSSGNWSLDLDSTNAGSLNLADGSTLTASATATDIHNNVSDPSAQATATVDAFTAAPTIAFDVASDGASDNTPRLSGTAEAGSKVAVTISDGTNSETITVDADSSGNWSLDLDSTNAGSLNLADGSTLTASATATDIHNNVSDPSAQATATVDAFTAAPTIAFDVASDGASDNTPRLSGTAEAGSKVAVTISDGTNSETITVDADSSGNWSLDLDSTNAGSLNLADGSTLTASATATDIHNNVSDPSAQATATVDAFTAAPTIAFDVASDGASDNTPRLSGTAEAGSKVAVTISDGTNSETITVDADSSGNWSLDLDSTNAGSLNLADGSTLTASATATDIHNNVSDPSAQATATVDAFTAAPTIAFDVASDGASDNTPRLSGTAEAGSKVAVTISDGTNSETITVDADSSGNWSLDLDSTNAGSLNLADGSTLTASATATDIHNNVSDPSAQATATVDAFTAAPTIAFDVASDGASDNTPRLSGTAEAGSKVAVTISDGTNSETITVDADSSGNWSLDLDSTNAGSLNLADGSTLTASATATDIHNNVSDPSAQATATVDAFTAAPTIAFDVASDGASDNTPRLSGTAEAGSKVAVTISDGTNSETITVDADSSGNWSLDLDSTNAGSLNLADGSTLTASATATDIHNNVSDPSAQATATVDAFTAAPTIAFDVASDGASDNTPRLSGTAEAGSKVAVTISDGTNSETITVDADSSGNWSLDLDSTNAGSLNLADGSTLTASATATDIHNNVSDPSAQATATVDAFTAAPTIAFDVASDGASDNTPRLSGTAEAGSKVAVTISDGTNSEMITVDADSSGNWSLDLDSTNAGSLNLADGSTLTASATATDIHNNVSDPSAQATATVDAFTAAPTIAFDVASDGASDNTPRLSGTAEAGSKVAVTISDGTNSETITVDADSSGNWSLDLDSTNAGSLNLADGSTLTASATATDIHNNVSDPSAQATATVDAFTAAPTIAFDGASDNTPRLSGTAEAGSKVAVTISDGTNSETITVDADSSGNWSLDLDSTNAGSLNLADGSTLTASATATDIHNNVSDPSAQATATVDAFTAAPTIAFDVASDGASDNTPRLSGTAEAGSKVAVTISDGTNSETITVDADSSGNWSLDLDSTNAGSLNLADGSTLTASATATDIHNNVSDPSAQATATVDAFTAAPTIAFDVASDGASDNTPRLSGTAEAGSKVAVTISDGTNSETITVDADSSGNWSLDLDSTNAGSLNLADGSTLTASATATDIHNNVSDPSAQATATVDAFTAAPTIAFDVASDGASDNTPRLSGTAEAGSKVAVTISDGTNSETITVDADSSGNWSLDLDSTNAGSLNLADGSTLTASATATDIHNNVSDPSAQATATVDAFTAAPTIAFDVASDGASDNTPRLSGTAEAGSKVAVTISDGTNSETITVDADSSGNWSLDLDSTNAGSLNLADGSTLTASATATDIHNNVSDPSAQATATVDAFTAAPTIAFDVASDGASDNTPRLSGTAEAGSKVAVTISDGTNSETITVDADSSGNWSLDLDSTNAGSLNLADGSTLTASATATDIHNNVSDPSAQATATVDAFTAAPTIAFDVASDGASDNTPRLSGTAEAGSKVAVTISDGTNSETITVDADSSGNWSLDLDSTNAGSLNLADGSTLTASATATDIHNNVSDPSAQATATVDAFTAAPTIAFDVASDGASDNTPRLSGTAEAGSKVAVTISDGTNSETITVDADSSGNWSLDLDSTNAGSLNLADGSTLTASATATDIHNNVSDPSAQATATVDAFTAAPTIAFDVASDGASDNTPRLSGTAEAGSKVAVTISDGTNSETITVDADSSGNWSLDLDSTNAGSLNLADGSTLTASATATDIHNNVSDPSAQATATVDAFTAAPTIAFDVASDGASDNTPRLSGTAEAGSKVAVTISDGTNSETITVDADSSGNWSLDLDSTNAGSLNLADGSTLTASATATDIHNNVSDPSAQATATVDAFTAAPTIAFDVASDGASDNTPRLSGTAEAGSKVAVTISDGTNSETITVDADSSGNWSLDLDSTNAGSLNLADGSTLTASATATDIHNNVSDPSAQATATVDAFTAAPTIAFDVASDGASDNTPRLSGTAEAGSKVAVTISDGTNSETITVDADSSGNWSLDLDSTNAGSLNLADGSTLTASATATDIHNNVSDPSAQATATVDAFTAAPTIAFDVASDGASDNTPRLSGTAEAGSKVAVTISDGTNSETITVDADSSGNWSLDLDSTNAGSLNLADGSTLTASATATDIHNNVSDPSAQATATVDAFTAAPTIAFDVASDGASDNTPRLSGTAEAGSKVAVTISDGTNSETITVDADSSGNWSLDLDSTNAGSLNLADGSTLTASATATDIHNNVSDPSAQATATVDAFTAAPTIAFDVASDGASDNTPRLSGTAEAGSKVAVTISDGTNSETITVDADSSGNWSLDLDSTNAGSLNLADGSTLTASATATDIHNNVSDPSAQATATVDAFTAAPTIAFDVASDGASDNTPRLSGTAEAGSKVAVTISDGTNSETITVDADSSGNWSLDLDSTNAGSLNLADGSTLTASATATDIHNNVSDPSAQATATVDAFTAAPTIAFDVASDGASDNTPRLSGTAEAGSKVAVTISDGTNSETITVDADSSGNWSLDLDSTNAGSLNLADGSTLTASATATDIHNNVSDPSAQATATVDAFTAAPTIAFDVASDGASDNTPRLSGTAEAGSKVAVTISDGTNSETITVDADSSGNWSLDLDSTNAGSLNLADGSTLTASATATDIHNNVSDPSAQATATVDAFTAAPTIAFDVASDGASDNTPRLSGTAEAGSKVAVTISDGTNSETITVDADSSGNWSLDLDSTNAGSLNLADGSTLTASATATDIHNNVSDPSAQATATVDAFTAAPTIAFDVASDGASDNTPRLSGTAEAGSKVAVTISDGTNSETITVDADSSGNWSLDLDSTNAGSLNLADGSTLTASAKATDIHGNEETSVSPASVTIDASAELTNVKFENTLTNTAGESFVGGEPVLSGVAEVGATVTVVVTDTTDSTKTATYTHVVTDSNGKWSIDIVDKDSFTVTHGGSFSVKVDSKDAVGNDATTVNLGPYTVDAVAADPTVDILDQTPENIADLVAGTQPLFSGTADPGAAIEVIVTFPAGSTPASTTLNTTADATNGNWAISFNDLGSNKTAFTHGATLSLAVTATDPTLNVSNTVTETYTVDYTTNETVDDNTFAGTTGDEVNFETQKADYLGPVSLTDSVTSTPDSSDETTTLTSFDDTVFVEDRGATYTNLGDGDDTIKFLKDEIAGVTGGTVFVDGGDGDDTADFSELTSSLYVNLSATAGTDVVRHTMSDGSILYRSFNDVENISTSSGRDLVEINRLTDLPNIDAGDGIDRLVLSQGGSTNIIDLTGGTSTIDGNTVTMSGFEVFEDMAVNSADTVVIDRNAVYVNGGDDSTGNSAYYDTLKVTESGSIVFAESNTDNYTYAGLHDYMTYATYFEKVEISNDALMILQADDANWFKDATNNTTGGSGRSILELSADASSGFMIDIDFFWADPSTWYYNDGSSETSLNNLSTLTHGNGAYLRDATNIEIHLDAGAVEAINNTYVYKNPYANSAVNLDWSALTWDNGINVEQANQDESNHHVVLADYGGNADSITLDEVVTIQSLTGASNLTLDENLAITGDMYDYIGTVTINNGNKLDVGGTLDMSTSSEMIMSYSAATGAAVSADHIDFAGSVELHVDYSSVNPNNADPQTGIIEEWAVFDASSTSGSIDELIFKTSGGNEFVESDLGAVVLVGTADGGVQVVKYDSSKHILDDGSNDLTGTTNAEVYYGFAGDDSITISDYDTDGDGTKDGVNLQYLDGGEGHDTLALQGDADNFQSLFTDELFRLNRIETLDITGLDGTLTLDEAAVRGLSDTNVLQVDGDSNTILDLNGFVEDTTKSVSGYTVYKSADSEIHVDTDITVK